MEYPFPELVSLLKFHCSPAEYQRIMTGRTRRSSPTSKEDFEYLEVLPQYKYAVCPICRVDCSQSIDTYDFNDLRKLLPKDFGWGYIPPVDLPSDSNVPCAHFIGIHAFINLHNHLPHQMRYFRNKTGEVPYITPWWLPDDIESYAVLHALPICRILEDKFIPTYTLFILTYFCSERHKLLEPRYAMERKRGEIDPEYYPSLVYPPHTQTTRRVLPAEDTSVQDHDKAVYDLSSWSSHGKLGWLDVVEMHLPLRIGKEMNLQDRYTNIPGRRYTYVVRNGVISTF